MTHTCSTTLDFSRPLDMLRASHERLRGQCEKLRGLAANLKDRGCDDEARQTSANVIRDLDAVNYQHKEDEEQDLLPRMMAAAAIAGGSSLTRMVADITTEHRAMHHAWTELRAALQAVAAGERASLDPLAVDRFVKLYRTHIAVEEASVYPLAEMLLSREDLATIGAHMARRRGVKFP